MCGWTEKPRNSGGRQAGQAGKGTGESQGKDLVIAREAIKEEPEGMLRGQSLHWEGGKCAREWGGQRPSVVEKPDVSTVQLEERSVLD